MKAYTIRLKNNELSERIANESIAQAKLFNIDVTPFDAINGLQYQVHLERLGIRPLKKFKKGKPGVYGCFLSHYYLWKLCVEENSPFIILEHDGYFIKPLPDNILDTFDDVLKLESENPYSNGYTARLAEIHHDPMIVSIINPQDDMDNGAGWYSIGAYAYIIKPHAAKKLIDWINVNGFLPADQQIGLDVVVVHECRPSLVRLHPFYIDTKGIKSMSMTMNTELL